MLAEESLVFADELQFGRRSKNGTELENEAEECYQVRISCSLQVNSPCLRPTSDAILAPSRKIRQRG
jgi:hypothetical protein